jgi:ribosomal protein L21E
VPRHFGISVVDSVTVPELSDWLHDRQVMTDLIHQHLSHAKERMKRQANKERYERHFQVGDLVFVKLQPYVQTTLAHWAHQKLAFKYFGPFTVIARVGSVAYTLELPASSAVHLTFPCFTTQEGHSSWYSCFYLISFWHWAATCSCCYTTETTTTAWWCPRWASAGAMVRLAEGAGNMGVLRSPSSSFSMGTCLGSSRYSSPGDC